MEGEIITLQDIYRYDYRGDAAWLPTGVRPEFVDKLAERGIVVPGGLFGGAEAWRR